MQHWAPRGDVADGHRATERYCREGGMSYCEDGHSWGLVVRVAGGRWIVFRPKKVLGDTEHHGGRKQCDVGARDHRCPDSGMRPHDNPATFGETQYLMYCRDRWSWELNQTHLGNDIGEFVHQHQHHSWPHHFLRTRSRCRRQNYGVYWELDERHSRWKQKAGAVSGQRGQKGVCRGCCSPTSRRVLVPRP